MPSCLPLPDDVHKQNNRWIRECPFCGSEVSHLRRNYCVYSGLPIAWSDVGWDHTASIDRIDNDKGYTEDNVQLVHKDVNMMRGSLDDEKFKQLCIKIANKIR